MGKKRSIERALRFSDSGLDQIIDLDIEVFGLSPYAIIPNSQIAISVLSKLTGEAEKLLSDHLNSPTPYLIGSVKSVIDDLNERYWAKRLRFTIACELTTDCKICDMSRLDWLGKNYLPSNDCVRTKFLRHETFDEFLNRCYSPRKSN